jgi:AcrR family transcriptional regulator
MTRRPNSRTGWQGKQLNQSSKTHAAAPSVDEKARHRLLRAALDSFAEIGYEASSIRGIAERAGVGFQLISYYFGSKEELWLAAVQESYDETERRFTGKVLTNDDPYERLREFLRYVIKTNLEWPQLRRILVQEFLAGSKRYTDILLPMVLKYYRTAILPNYERVVADGLISMYTAREVALLVGNMTLANLASMFQVEFFLDTKETDADDLLEKQVDLLVRQLTVAGDSGGGISVAHELDRKKIEGLEADNRRLKELVGSLMLEKARSSELSAG